MDFLMDFVMDFIMESGDDEPQSAALSKSTGPVAGVKVLVVDTDSARRAFVSKFLLSLGYEVVTATLASEALSIIGEMKNEIKVVLVGVQLGDMEIYKLIEKMKENTNIPSFMMTAYDKRIASISKSKLCLRTSGDLQQLTDVEGLTKETVSNYLQKYRQSMNLRASPLAQHFNGYVSITKKSRGKCPLSLENQSVTYNPSFNRKDLSNFKCVSVLDTPARFLTLESSSSQEPPFGQNQLSPPLKQEVVKHSTSGLGQQLNFSTLLAFNTSGQFCLANEKIDEIFYTKESQMFTDEDLNMWLSTIPDNVSRYAVA